MRRTLATLVAFALLGTFGVQVGWGLPAQAISMLEAVDCCAEHCDHASPGPSMARHCCGVEEAPPSASSSPGVFAVVAGVFPATTAAGRALEDDGHTLRTSSAPPLSRGAPLFLVNRSLLI